MSSGPEGEVERLIKRRDAKIAEKTLLATLPIAAHQ
jgi:hypothetical protein